MNDMTGRFLMLAIGLVVGANRISAQETKCFDTDSFKVEVTHMLPVSYPSRILSYGYSVEVRHDSAFVHLPYMGRVYQPVLNHDGLNFEFPLTDFKTKKMRKDGWRVEFKVAKVPVFYKFTVTAYDNGRADVIMIPSNAQSISYAGQWDAEY